ncbi:MAG TPA: response regulator [Candidatus Methylomirabilis sp.]|nr:response regulator [Candidatus Methylomirabilis sp.]
MDGWTPKPSRYKSHFSASARYHIDRPSNAGDGGGPDAITAIHAEFPDAKIIVLTTYKGDVQITRALKAGAEGYLLKNTFHKELMETIREIQCRKESSFSRSIVRSSGVCDG